MADGEKRGHEGHRKRLRERFASGGLSGFQDYEVVELLLTLATPRKDCKAAAKEVMATFGSLRAVFEAEEAELVSLHGIGPANVLGLRLIREVARRYLEERAGESDVIRDSQALREFLTMKIGSRRRECFVAIYLNAKNRVAHSEILFEGSLTSSVVYPREVVRVAIAHKAAAVVFAHNHPSGDPTPSVEDIRVTRRLVSALRVMNITVHEHLIVGSSGHYSFAENGYIEQFVRETDELAHL